MYAQNTHMYMTYVHMHMYLCRTQIHMYAYAHAHTHVCITVHILFTKMYITNESLLFEVITSLFKLGLRCESVSLVFFPSHSPQSMPKQAFDMTQQKVVSNVVCQSCGCV